MSLQEMYSRSAYKCKNQTFNMVNVKRDDYDCTYLTIEKSRQQKMMRELKEKIGLSWDKIAILLNVSRSSVFNYLSGTCKIPYSNFLILCKKAKIDPAYFGEFEFVYMSNKERTAKFPEYSDDFVELLGAIYGDGCLTSNYSVVIVCDAKSDRKYVCDVVYNKFYKLFGLKPTIRQCRNAIHCRLYSKQVFEFLSNEIGVPVGKKKDMMRVPEIVKNNKNYARAFLRGLFDTDGGFHRHNPFSAKVEITSHSSEFLRDIRDLLSDLDLQPVLMKRCVYVIAKAKVDKFFETVNPSNFKHLYKYQQYKMTGQVPRHRDIDYLNLEFFKCKATMV